MKMVPCKWLNLELRHEWRHSFLFVWQGKTQKRKEWSQSFAWNLTLVELHCLFERTEDEYFLIAMPWLSWNTDLEKSFLFYCWSPALSSSSRSISCTTVIARERRKFWALDWYLAPNLFCDSRQFLPFARRGIYILFHGRWKLYKVSYIGNWWSGGKIRRNSCESK